MPEIYRETRYTRERDDSPSDDEKYKATTVRRYKVTPNRVERVERIEREVDVDDDRRSRYSAHPGRSSGDLLEVDRRVERTYSPARSRSALDPSPRQTTTTVERKVVERDDRDAYYYRDDRDRDRPRSTYIERERVVDRDGDGIPDARSRTVIERKVIPRDVDDDFHDDRDRARTTVYKKTEEVERDAYSPRDRDWDRRSNAPWDRDDRELDVRIDKRVERRGDSEVRIERRVEEREERRDDRYAPQPEVYTRETEYYEPAPAPIVIRQRAPEQRIIVQEAPLPAPVIISREAQQTRELVRRPEPRDDEREYYYRREERNNYGDDRREEDYAVVARRRRDDRRGRYSDGDASDNEYYVKRTIRRESSGSPDHHHKRHLAEGALAGAGAMALLASKRSSRGELPENRGRKVLAGAALGALSTEVVRRAKSAYDDRYGDERGGSRSRSRGGEDRHSKLKTGLGIAAAALAVAGAAKYYQSTKVDKEESSRGRSRRRDEYSDYSRSPSRKRSKSRAASMAKAAVGTAAVAGLVKHFRDKSKARSGGSKSRSRSRLRTGAEIVGAGLVGAAGKKLYDRFQDKKERERDLSEDDEYYRDEERDRRHRSRSRSVSRSAARPPYPEAAGPADPELGMVEYGAHPLYSDPRDGPARGATDDGERVRRRRRRRDADESDAETEREATKKRSRSRLRDLATGAAAAGAAAIGIKKFQDNKNKKEEKERSRERSRHRDDRDRERERDRARDGDHDSDEERERVREQEKQRLRHRRERDRKRYEDDSSTDIGYDDPYDPRRSPSPAHASGGAYYPPAGGYPPAAHAEQATGFTQHPNMATTNLADPYYEPYHPPDYTAPPPVPGPPPNSAATANGFPPAPLGPEHVSAASRPGSPERVSPRHGEEDGVNPATAISSTRNPELDPPAKSVVFIPLSPKSSQTLALHRQQAAHHSDSESDYLDHPTPDSEEASRELVPSPRSRRISDPSSNRPYHPSSYPDSVSDSDGTVELLPDRFDSAGRPLRPGMPRMHTRRGDFVYKSPRPEGWNVAGQWGVAGTDDKAVERIVRKVTGVVEGRESVLGFLGGILSGRLLESSGGEESDAGRSEREVGGGRRRARIADGEDDGEAGRRRRGLRHQGLIGEGYDDESDDEERRRRRRKRRRSE